MTLVSDVSHKTFCQVPVSQARGTTPYMSHTKLSVRCRCLKLEELPPICLTQNFLSGAGVSSSRNYPLYVSHKTFCQVPVSQARGTTPYMSHTKLSVRCRCLKLEELPPICLTQNFLSGAGVSSSRNYPLYVSHKTFCQVPVSQARGTTPYMSHTKLSVRCRCLKLEELPPICLTQNFLSGAGVSSSRDYPLYVSRDDKTTSLHHYG